MKVSQISARCVLPEPETRRAAITIKDAVISEVKFDVTQKPKEPYVGDSSVVLPDSYLVSPGLIDLQINGALGGEFRSNGDHVQTVADFLLAHGVTGFLPTVTSLPLARYPELLPRISRELDSTIGGAEPLGIHVEGPVLALEFKGGHPQSNLLDEAEPAMSILELSNRIRILTVAPEIPGVIENLIPRAVSRGVLVSMGHTAADSQVVRAAAKSGASLATHLFNAMRRASARDAAVAGTVLAGEPKLSAGIIADLVHVEETMLRLAICCCSPDRLFLVSDSSAVTGLPTGRHVFQDRAINADGSAARLDDGTLVGSTLTLDRAVRNLVHTGLATPESAIDMASRVPADVLRDGRRGRIAVNCVADFTVWDSALEIAMVIKDGKVVHDYL